MNGIKTLRRTAEHEHVIRTRRQQMVDLTEHQSRRGSNLEPFEIRPIKLIRSYGWQLLVLDDDLGAYPFAGQIPIVQAAQLRDHAAARVAATVLHFEHAIRAVPAQRPGVERRDVVVGLGVGLHFEPPFHAEHAADAAEGDPFFGVRAHCGVAGRADALRRGGSSPGLFEQIRDPLRGLSPASHPVVDTAEIDAQSLLAAGCNRVEEPDALDVTTAAWTATIRHHDMIERTLDRAAARQPNDHHSEKPSVPKNAKAARRTAQIGAQFYSVRGLSVSPG